MSSVITDPTVTLTGDVTGSGYRSLATTVTKINGVDQTAAWASYTPTIGAQTGTLTSATALGYYDTIGKTIIFRIEVVITTNGTAAGYVTATLPVTSQGTGIGLSFSGVETNLTGNLLKASGLNATTIVIEKYDGTYPGANNTRLTINGTYESA